MERLMNTEEVAEILRVDVVTVRRLVTRGELIAYRIAGEYRFTQGGVENFIESQRVIVGPAQASRADKFTERSRKVLTLANEEARRYNHEYIGTEHLLLAIMSEGGGIAARVLEVMHIEPSTIRSQVEDLHPPEEQERIYSSEIGLTPRAKKSIELAVDEAHQLDHHYLGTEHLLLGLLRQEDGLAEQLLCQAGVTLEETRNLVKQILAGGLTTVVPTPPHPVEPSSETGS